MGPSLLQRDVPTMLHTLLARLRSANAPANMAIIRHTALNLLSKTRPTTSFKNRRKQAGWNIDYLENRRPTHRMTVQAIRLGVGIAD